MASCSANNRVILQLEDMLMQTMQETWMIGGLPQVMYSLLVEDLFVGSL